MPRVQSANCGASGLTIVCDKTTYTLTASTMTAGNNTAAAVESAIAAWLMSKFAGKLVTAAHVFTLSPLSFTVFIAQPGTVVPASWWL